jgi:hypothetical protein
MKLRVALIMVLLGFVLNGCSETTSNNSNPTQGLFGNVRLFDSTGWQVFSDLQGVTITESTTGRTTTTDVDGSWSISDLDPGYYSVQAEKPGYSADMAGATVESGHSAGLYLFLTSMPDEIVHLYRASSYGGIISFSAIANLQPYFLVDRTPNARTDTQHLISPVRAMRDGTHFWEEDSYPYESANWKSIAGLKAGDTVYVSACVSTHSSVWRSPSELLTGWFDHGGPKSNVIPVVLR